MADHHHKALAFGGSGLDRAAHLRLSETALAEAFAHQDARILPLWRGKPLLAAGDALGWLSPGFFEPSGPEAPVFLGLDDGGPRFAVNMSDWQPTEPSGGSSDSFTDTTEQMHPSFPDGTRFCELRNCMTRLTPRDAELAATARALLSWHARHRYCANCGAATVVVRGGWQRDCTACAASHYPRTDPAVIMLITRGNDLLVGRAPNWPEGMYSLLAGFVEPGETMEAAVRREVQEETTVAVGRVSYLMSQPWPFPASLMLACRGEALSRDITLEPEELASARWVSREEMMTVYAGIHAEMTAARPGSIARHVIGLWLADALEDR